jgi:hypothetical protein
MVQVITFSALADENRIKNRINIAEIAELGRELLFIRE